MSGKREKMYIMLWQEEEGFCSAERPAFGSALIEDKKGVQSVSVDVKNIKSTKEGYRIYLISSKPKNTEGIYIGKIYPDHGGKGHAEFSLPETPDNFNVIALIYQNIEDGSFSAPLAGYRDGKVNWKKDFSLSLKIKAASPKKEPDIIAASAEPVKKQSEEAAEIAKGDKSERPEGKKAEEKEEFATVSDFFNDYYALETTSHDEFRKMVKRFNNELDELEKIGLIDEEKAQRIRKAGTDNIYSSNKTMESKEKKEANETTKVKKEDTREVLKRENPHDDVDYMFAENPRLVPFPYDTRLDFIRIVPEELVFFNVPVSFMKGLFLNSNYSKYKHLILARDENEYILGVPDKYDSSMNREAAGLGFRKFKTIEENNAFGYWLKTIQKI